MADEVQVAIRRAAADAAHHRLLKSIDARLALVIAALKVDEPADDDGVDPAVAAAAMLSETQAAAANAATMSVDAIVAQVAVKLPPLGPPNVPGASAPPTAIPSAPIPEKTLLVGPADVPKPKGK